MSLITWAESKMKKIGWIDMKLVQFSAFCLGLLIGAYFSALILPYWWFFILLAVLAVIKPACKVFGK